MGQLRVPRNELPKLRQYRIFSNTELNLKPLSDEDEEFLDTVSELYAKYEDRIESQPIELALYDDDDKRAAAIHSYEFLSDEEKELIEKYCTLMINDLEQAYLRMKYKTSYVTLEMYEETFGSL